MGAIKPFLKALERLASLTGLACVARDERVDECTGRDDRVASLAHIPCVGGDDECVRMSTGKGSPGRGHATDACVGPKRVFEVVEQQAGQRARPVAKLDEGHGLGKRSYVSRITHVTYYCPCRAWCQWGDRLRVLSWRSCDEAAGPSALC